MKKFLGWAIICLIVLGVVTYYVLPRSFELVKPGYRGVKTEWGEIVPKSYKPGIVWKIPFTKDMGNDVLLVDTKPQRYEYDLTLSTKDLQRISFKCSTVCELEADSVYRLVDKYPGGAAEYEEKVIKDLVGSTLRALMGQTDIWMFVSQEQEPMIAEATQYIVNDNLIGEKLMKVCALRNLGYQASAEFEALVEQTVQAKQGITLEDYKAQMAKKATLRVKEEALQTYERLAAVAKAQGLEIQIKAEAVKDNPFIAQYEVAKALQNWKGELTLPQVLTLMSEAGNKGGSDLIKFFPIPTTPSKK